MTTTQNRGKTEGQSVRDPDMWQRRVDHALKNLGDRSILNRSPLSRLAYVNELAESKYEGHILPCGLALHEILIECITKITTDLSNEPNLARACNYLDLLVKGLSCQEISKQLGLSREHVSRVYRKKAVELATEEFLSVVKRSL
jgi:hypothetical protein